MDANAPFNRSPPLNKDILQVFYAKLKPRESSDIPRLTMPKDPLNSVGKLRRRNAASRCAPACKALPRVSSISLRRGSGRIVDTSRTRTGALGFPEARKLALTSLPQPLQHRSHFRELALQPRPRIIVRAAIEFLVDEALQFRDAICCVVAERLRNKLDIERRLHQSLQVVLWA